MRGTQKITTRTFVWLAAVALPFQGLPSASCGCNRVGIDSDDAHKVPSCCADKLSTSGCNPPGVDRSHDTDGKVSRCGSERSCCQQEPDCCSRSMKATCQCSSRCQCGDDCQCAKNNDPAEPAVPPVENRSPERVAADPAAAKFFTIVYLPSTTRQHMDRFSGADALTAHDCCIALCRFTL